MIYTALYIYPAKSCAQEILEAPGNINPNPKS